MSLEGPLFEIDIKRKLKFLSGYHNKSCKIYVGSRPLTEFQENLTYIEPVLNVGHWFLLLDFGSDRTLLIESSKLGRLKGMSEQQVSKIAKSDGKLYYRLSDEGSEVLAYNQLIRLNPNYPKSNYLTLISRIIFNYHTLIRFCLAYLKTPYNYIDRNCQCFARALSYSLTVSKINYVSQINLNLDGVTYVLLFVVILIVVFLFWSDVSVVNEKMS